MSAKLEGQERKCIVLSNPSRSGGNVSLNSSLHSTARVKTAAIIPFNIVAGFQTQIKAEPQTACLLWPPSCVISAVDWGHSGRHQSCWSATDDTASVIRATPSRLVSRYTAVWTTLKSAIRSSAAPTSGHPGSGRCRRLAARPVSEAAPVPMSPASPSIALSRRCSGRVERSFGEAIELVTAMCPARWL